MDLHKFAVILDRMPATHHVVALGVKHADILLCPDEVRVVVQRHASTLAEAVISAIDDVEAVGLRPIRVYDDDWVTMADIGARIGRCRETIRLWSMGVQGPGGFPPPLNPNRDTKFYSWLEVSLWLRRHMYPDLPIPEPDLVVANLLLQARRLGARSNDWNALAAMFVPRPIDNNVEVARRDRRRHRGRVDQAVPLAGVG